MLLEYELICNYFFYYAINLFYLSDAPHAVPHAALVSVSAFFHPKRFDNAILLPPDFLFVVIFVARLQYQEFLTDKRRITGMSGCNHSFSYWQ